eukprot:GHRQ01025631.1.p1 GENE.GHRQ01025631.1~~GHRQ01025631.1.p1  ORF type:complete len:127 (-),score=9.98 GHRQ01025631.1:340-720(-)
MMWLQLASVLRSRLAWGQLVLRPSLWRLLLVAALLVLHRCHDCGALQEAGVFGSQPVSSALVGGLTGSRCGKWFACSVVRWLALNLVLGPAVSIDCIFGFGVCFLCFVMLQGTYREMSSGAAGLLV